MIGVGIVVSVYFVGIVGFFGFMFVIGIVVSKKFIKKVEKYEIIVFLVEVKYCLICRFVLKVC